MWRFFKIIFLTGIALALFITCSEKDNELQYSGEDSSLIFVDEVMKYWYLWNEEVPDLDIFQYDTPSDLLDALKHTPPDNWSFIDKKEVVEKLFDDGEYFGFGFMMKFDDNDILRVSLVYENSEAYDLGIRRGNIIDKINGIPSSLFDDFHSFHDFSPASFTFDIYDNDLQLHIINLDKENILLNGVLFSNIYNVSGHTTGYVVYDSFLGYSEEELEQVFSYFKASDITELIIDLRYNGGGYISLAQELCEMIILPDVTNEIFYSAVHNDNVGSTYDTTIHFGEHGMNLALDRVFFITTGESASASELVINSLEPYMEVLTIGMPTHGKPVGMYGFEFQDWLMLPVTVQMMNADGYGSYFDGLAVDCFAEDGLDHNWGDETEPSLSQAFHYISYGSWNNTLVVNTKSAMNKSIIMQGWKDKNILLLDR